MNNLPEKAGQELERNFVRDTYEHIADQFSGTRYKKWPLVQKFLENLQPGSLLLDVGCGNGKYLDNKQTINLGCDISHNLLTICRNRDFQVVNCDMMNLPFRSNQFDAIICIAALHHIVTAKRRQQCLEYMIDLLSIEPNNRLLIQVWSYEQHLEKDNPYLKKKQPTTGDVPVETKELQVGDDKLIVPIHKNRTPFVEQDLLVPFKTKLLKPENESGSSSEHQKEILVENLRYYHVFREGELDLMLQQISNIKIVESYYDKGNWCAIISKLSEV